MHRLNELAARLTPAQLKQVEDFAEFLAVRDAASTDSAAFAGGTRNTIRFDGWAGCLAGAEPGKSDKQLVHEAWNGVLDKFD